MLPDGENTVKTVEECCLADATLTTCGIFIFLIVLRTKHGTWQLLTNVY